MTRLLTDEQHEFLVSHVKGISNVALANLINERYGTSFTAEQIKRYKHRRGVKSGFDGKFKPGNVGYWSGKSRSADTWTKMQTTMLERGHTNGRCLPIGSEHFDKDCYVMVKIAQPNVWKQKHIVLWEQAHGSVPEGMKVVFKNRDKYDIRLENLALCSQGVNAFMSLNHMIPCDEMVIAIADDIMTIKRKIKELKKQ